MSIYDNKFYCGLKSFLKNNPLTRPIITALHRRKAVKKQLAGADVFHRQIHQVFPDIVKKFDSLGIDWFICFGTLLGAVREHDFIKHDDDLELGVFSDQYYSQLAWKFAEIGFKKQYRYYMTDSPIQNEGFVEKYSNGTIHFDLFVYSRNDKNIWCWSYLKDEANVLTALKLQWPNSGLQHISFQNLEVPVPCNPQGFLEALYGKGWSKPCIYWDDTMAGNIAETDKTHGRFENTEQ
ncbi:MAG: LicD family protein [Spirochaetia bacterium]|nr:LicD family protein [Spirochaetia bacterium]